MSVRIITGDCRDVLRTLPGESVHCCVTSPPYWGLRDYGVDGQIGLEESIYAWVDEMVAVFREVRRVLRSDGTLWLNLGDSYAQNGGSGWQGKNGQRADRRFTASRDSVGMREATRRPPDGIKAKDLIGQPWLVAFALRADGWYLRQEIIWHKPNPMPESVRDRCTKAHEQIFLLSKSPRYFYDFDAMREEVSGGAHARRSTKMPDGWDTGAGAHGSFHRNGREKGARKLATPGQGIKNNTSFESVASGDLVEHRNKRSVWTVPSEPFKEAHFATFPPALIEPCIKAGCPQGGVVLDPFGGAGTTGMVADRLQRDALLIELNPEYVEIARKRIHGDAPLLAEVAA